MTCRMPTYLLRLIERSARRSEHIILDGLPCYNTLNEPGPPQQMPGTLTASRPPDKGADTWSLQWAETGVLTPRTSLRTMFPPLIWGARAVRLQAETLAHRP